MVELLKIEDSPPAPNLKLVATPNEWRKESAKDLRDRKLSDRQLRYMEFFQQLIDALREQGLRKRANQGTEDHTTSHRDTNLSAIVPYSTQEDS